MSLGVHYVALDESEPTYAVELIHEAIKAFPELTWQSTPSEAQERILSGIVALDRVELFVRDSQGRMVGFASVAEDADGHVGEVLGVQWFFVPEEHRGPVGYSIRKAIYSIARRLDHKVLAYTHRIGEGRYELTYKRLTPRRCNG